LKNLKFSIITPSHKYQSYFLDLYESLLNQTYENWEWIIFLNGTFEIEQVPKNIFDDSRVKVYSDYDAEERIGFIKKQAFSYGTGDILVEVDHDDILIENCLEELNIAFQDEEIGFVYSNNAVYQTEGEFVPYSSSFGWEYEKFKWNDLDLISMKTFEPTSHSLSYIWFAPDHIRAWRKSVYHNIGGHNEEYYVCDDLELMMKTYLETKMFHIQKVLYIYRITGKNSFIERGDDIANKNKELHKKYAQVLAERDADLKGLLKVDLGGGLFPREGYLTIDIEGSEIIHDLNEGIPLEDNSVGVLNASHLIEHLRDPLKTMREIHRVLAHGGWAFIEVPSTDGRGAWQDPTHVSFWNENSFHYYTKRSKAQYIRNESIKFSTMLLETSWWVENVAVVNAHLVAIKNDSPRFPGPIEI
jgi:glycosyltransferase involved in cell wall biosynthesis